LKVNTIFRQEHKIVRSSTPQMVTQGRAIRLTQHSSSAPRTMSWRCASSRRTTSTSSRPASATTASIF
jgi:hypothetical protein